MKTYHIEGIVLRNYNLFEKDKAVELLTPTKGKIKLLAKYANTTKFRFGGKLDPTTHINCTAYKGKTFDLLSQCDLIKNFPHLRNDWTTLKNSFYYLEICKKATSFEQENQPLFELLHQTLHHLNNNENQTEIKNHFHVEFLKQEGLLPNHKSSVDENEFKRTFEEYVGQAIPSLI